MTEDIFASTLFSMWTIRAVKQDTHAGRPQQNQFISKMVNGLFMTGTSAYYSTCTTVSPLVAIIMNEPPGEPPGDQGVQINGI
jgi:hypothetical protein